MKGSSEGKQAKGSLVALAFGAPKSAEKVPRSMPKGGGETEYDDDVALHPPDEAHDASFDAFANAVGIPAASRGKAKEALKSYVRACIQESEGGEY